MIVRRIYNEIRRPFLFLCGLFLLSVWLGYFSGTLYPKETHEAVKGFSENLIPLKNADLLKVFFFLFINNSLKALFMVVLGTFFGIFPLVFVIINGAVIGLVSFAAVSQAGIVYLIMGLVPHGIIELPAFLAAGAYGLILGKRFYRKFTKRERFAPYFLHAIKNTFFYIFPALAAAAFIETFITGPLLRSFF
jgi:stage II sporulation protein M